MSPPAPNPAPWWTVAFEALAAIDPALSGTVDDRAEAEVELVERLAEVGPGARVLDVGCGTGRHAIVFGERNHVVTGIDLSPRLLREARRRWDTRNPGVRGPTWMPGDMRWLPEVGPVDLVVMLGGAFGMFMDEADHLRVLTAVAGHLRPGGRLVLQTPNPYHWSGRPRAQHLPPGAMAEGVDVVRSARFDALSGRVEERFVCFKDGHRHEPPARTHRSFTPVELVALLGAAGFAAVDVHGTEGWAVPEEALPVHPTDSVWFWVVAST